jgi:hypothetical protein
MPDESLSGRAHRNTVLATLKDQPSPLRWWIVAMLAELLFWPVDRGEHCRLAHEQDISRAAARLGALSGRD